MNLPTPDQLRLLAEHLDGIEHPDIQNGDEVNDLLSAAAALIPWVIKTMRPDDVLEAHSQCCLILAALNTRLARVLATEQKDYIGLLEAGEVLLAAVAKGTRSLRENSAAVAALYDADHISQEGEYARRVLRKFRAKVFSDYDENGDPQPNLIGQHHLVTSPPKALRSDDSSVEVL